MCWRWPTTVWTAGILGFIVIWKLWKWRLWATAALMVPLILIDTSFVMASTLKLFQGAWLPVLVGAILIVIMVTWRRGTRLLAQKTRRVEVPFAPLVKSLEEKAALHRPRHRRVSHQRSRVRAHGAAAQPQAQQGAARAQRDPDHRQRGHSTGAIAKDRVANETDQRQIHADSRCRFGFMERPNVPKALAVARKQGWQFDIMSTSFFLSRRSVRPDPRSGMPRWQDRLYIFLAHNADDASSYFQLPTDRVVEIGTQVTV